MIRGNHCLLLLAAMLVLPIFGSAQEQPRPSPTPRGGVSINIGEGVKAATPPPTTVRGNKTPEEVSSAAPGSQSQPISRWAKTRDGNATTEKGPQASDSWFIAIEPNYFKTKGARPIPGARRASFVPAIIKPQEVQKIKDSDLAALGVGWEKFFARSRGNAQELLKTLTFDPVKGEQSEFICYRAAGDDLRISSVVLAPDFLRLFQSRLGSKLFVVIPNMREIYIFPADPERVRKLVKPLRAAYKRSAYPVSLEIFSITPDAFRAEGTLN